MKKDYKDEIKKLIEYKEKHNFDYNGLAEIINITPRSLRRWLNYEYAPIPIYRKKIDNLIKKG